MDKEDGCSRYICGSCLDDINANKTPMLSLANNLWVGEIPNELAMLTLPERVLVALSYPAAYIVKLYPKRRGALNWDAAGLNSGLRGNVSTYRLHTSGIAAMVEGDLLPPKPVILATTIGISIVGPNNFPERCMPSFLTVSQCHLWNALLFLKQHNPLYCDITISKANISLFPKHGIPEVILSSVRHLPNVEMVDAERDNYVPDDDAEDVFNELNTVFPTGCNIEEESVIKNTVQSNVFPMQSHGVLDSNVSEVDDNQLFAHALSNMSEQYTVQRGNSFINEYPQQCDDQSLSIGDSDNPNHLLRAFPYLFPYATGGFEVE
ncbi:uncharacterized protein EDB91DRAFT_1247163 [Suillus paluster]|uniref:uncharacterized protein n=1 Tax=Suillus paluster TaxID=48578 RepID=UPI001B862AB4|nr:uncharacterized protein EDB91DRAFT_1247163 [Suillus paluster]KAG1743672.1 hypothetical protein EDB91DRAFT_1247163 [Suillus paluster]